MSDSSEIQPQTVFNKIINPNLEAQNPDSFYKPNLNRYFNKRNQEYRGLILTSGLLNPLFNQISMGIELYFQERLGYEILYSYYRDPIFKKFSDIDDYKPYEYGHNLMFKQKFYQKDSDLGMAYFGHQISLMLHKHQLNGLDQTVLPFQPLFIQSREISLEYGMLYWIYMDEKIRRERFCLRCFYWDKYRHDKMEKII